MRLELSVVRSPGSCPSFLLSTASAGRYVFGYRPGRGVADAIAAVRAAFAAGRVWTLDADVTRYFDRVLHSRLLEEFAIWLDEEAVVGLFALWLKSFSRFGRGIAQGAPISPLLANLFLHPLDRLPHTPAGITGST